MSAKNKRFSTFATRCTQNNRSHRIIASIFTCSARAKIFECIKQMKPPFGVHSNHWPRAPKQVKQIAHLDSSSIISAYPAWRGVYSKAVRNRGFGKSENNQKPRFRGCTPNPCFFRSKNFDRHEMVNETIRFSRGLESSFWALLPCLGFLKSVHNQSTKGSWTIQLALLHTNLAGWCTFFSESQNRRFFGPTWTLARRLIGLTKRTERTEETNCETNDAMFVAFTSTE